jgi:O-antigen/teichoic acid export membrane protein
MNRWPPLLPRGSARRGIARTTVVIALSLLFNTAAGVIVARQLGAEGRGHFAAIVAWYSVALVLADIGQTGSVTYHVARFPKRAARFVASARTVMLCGGFIIGAVGIALSGLLAGSDSDVTLAYRIAFSSCVLQAFAGPFVFALQGAALERWNQARLIQPASYFLIIVGFVLIGDLTLITVSWALLISIGIQGLTAWVHCSRLNLTGGRSDRATTRPLLAFGLPHGASAIPATLGGNIDKIALSRVVQPAELGQYAVASTVISLGALLVAAVGNVMFPLLSKAGLSAKDRHAAERRSLGVTAVGATISCVCLAASGQWLIPLVFGPGFEDATRLVFWLIPAVVASTAAYLVGDLLRARRMPAAVAVAQWLGVVVTASGIGLLAPSYGLEGTAVATGLGQSVCLIASLVALRRARALAARER